MYPIKHPFIYEDKMKLTETRVAEDAEKIKTVNVDNAALIKQSSRWWIQKNIAAGTHQKGWENLAWKTFSVLCSVITFHCFGFSLVNSKMCGKWNLNDSSIFIQHSTTVFIGWSFTCCFAQRKHCAPRELSKVITATRRFVNFHEIWFRTLKFHCFEVWHWTRWAH